MKCAAELARPWQSAAHCSLDSVAGRIGPSRQVCLLLNHPSRGSPSPRPFRQPLRPPPVNGRHRPCVYRYSPQKNTAGDPCVRSLLCGFEAARAILKLACLLLATLALDYADLKPGGPPQGFLNRSAHLCLCPCAPEAKPSAPTPKRDPKAAPWPQKEPPK